jgi:hypothetical protein
MTSSLGIIVTSLMAPYPTLGRVTWNLPPVCSRSATLWSLRLLCGGIQVRHSYE